VRSPATPLSQTILPQLFGHRAAATNSVLRHPAILDSVNASVPRRYNGEVGAHWHLLFTTDYDGTSLAHLLHQCASDAAMLVIVRSVDGRVFGAYINELLEATTRNDEWHGTGECFLFALARTPYLAIARAATTRIRAAAAARFGPRRGNVGGGGRSSQAQPRARRPAC
jgi:hypothetical protein